MEVTKIKGISDKRADDLKKLGIVDTAELIRYFPRTYIDLRTTSSIAEAYHNDIVLTVGRVVSNANYSAYSKVKFVKIICEQNGMPFTVIWFNQPYVLNKIKPNTEYLFYGRVQNKYGALSLVNPSFEPIDNNLRLKGIVPQYSLRGNLSQKIMRDSIRLAVNIEKPKSIIPEFLLKKYGLSDLYSAYKEVHNPTDFESKTSASDRIAVEEYFALISAFKILKGDKLQARINRYICSAEKLKEFTQRFPFEFTAGQKTAVNEIYKDLTGASVMNRLMQGDVGSGKTAVSLCAVFMALTSGYQAVNLSPTEVLAKQNFQVLTKYLPEYKIELLVGSLTPKQKKEIKERVKSGDVDVLVGTHAVLEEDVVFKNLALCVCDEQQRFGVAQRSSLMNKGILPDVLVMSATPIPRTLSLIFYGDLDITTISDKPKNRQSITTGIVSESKYNDMLDFIETEVKAGRQAYFVCPMIEGDLEGSVMSVTELYEDLSNKYKNIRFGLLHGKMKDKEKDAVMQNFKDKHYDVLVSTTVIEVGVDVPNATIMVIYNAERFGLSQLHQLRGRVGRSDLKSYCFLLSNAKSDKSIERLNILKNTDDGFKISECDYELRGHGDFLGVRQSGKAISDLGFLSYTTQAVFLAKKISDEAFIRGENIPQIKEIAMKKYNRLKDITLN